MPTKDVMLTSILTPLSWIYGAVTYVRNKLFDAGIILKEKEFDVPVVSVGNLTVGGTGKTPHVEYLISRMMHIYNIGVLSRGYKRETKGFVLATSKSTPAHIGDESYMIYQKFGMKVRVAVCENRREGIKQLLACDPAINLIILDDAFQHRYVKPRVSLLLVDSSRPVYEDKLLPLGRLRESVAGMNRADIVVVTKCAPDMQPIHYRLVKNELNLLAYQKLFFSRYIYGGLMPVFPDDSPYDSNLGMLTESDSVLLTTGIAHPRAFVRYFGRYPFKVKVLHFPDHHAFTRKDLNNMKNIFTTMSGARKIIITTEKDAVRFLTNPYFPQSMKPFMYYLPIAVEMIKNPMETDIVEEIVKIVESRSRDK